MARSKVNSATLSQQGGLSKVSRYKWSMKGVPGEFLMIPKEEINIDMSYQRDLHENKVIAIASAWSWVGCGVIIISERGGKYYAMDGQHRVAGSMRRDDIKSLPCLVFKVATLEEEAQFFLDLNTLRAAMSALEKQKALEVSDDDAANYIKSLLKSHGLNLTKAAREQGEIKCIAQLRRMFFEDRIAMETVLGLAVTISDTVINKDLLDGLFYLHTHGCDLTDARINNRIVKTGGEILTNEARKMRSLQGKGGAKVCGYGMLEVINKGLHKRITLPD